MNKEIFQASLNNGNSDSTRSYDIGKLFYVAFFGGVIPTVVLGTVNARWLKIENRLVELLVGLGVIILLAKVVIYSLLSTQYFHFDSRYLRWSYKIASVVLYLAYYNVIKQKYKQHMLLISETKPLLKDAITWIVVGMVVEFILLLVGRMIIEYVI